jgi:hypothetical protein
METISKEDILMRISQLESEHDSTEDFESRLEIKDKIHNLKMVLSGEKPMGSAEIECIGCGS